MTIGWGRTVLCIAGLTLLSAAAQAAQPAVMRVLVVQPTDLKMYVHELGIAQEMMNKAGLSVRLRVWQAQFAGEKAGTIAVALEFANLTELARYYELVNGSTEFAAELAKVTALRKVVSDSLYQNIGP